MPFAARPVARGPLTSLGGRSGGGTLCGETSFTRCTEYFIRFSEQRRSGDVRRGACSCVACTRPIVLGAWPIDSSAMQASYRPRPACVVKRTNHPRTLQVSGSSREHPWEGTGGSMTHQAGTFACQGRPLYAAWMKCTIGIVQPPASHALPRAMQRCSRSASRVHGRWQYDAAALDRSRAPCAMSGEPRYISHQHSSGF